MAKSKNVPQLRFQGFADDWEQRKLGELSPSFEYGLNAAATEYDGENKYIRITDIDDDSREFKQKDITSPDTDLSNAENYKLSEGDILFARTGASVGKTYIYKPSDGLVYYAGFLIRARIKKEYNPEFIFQNTLTSNYEKFIKITSMRSGQPGVNAQEYSQFEIMAPSKPEQDKIACYFRNLDNLITLHQSKYDKLLALKRSMLEKMFPKAGSDVPEIRFSGFTEAWEQRKLSDVLTSYTDPVEIPHTGYDRLGIRSHAKGTFFSYVPAGHELQTAQMHRVAADKFIVNITFGWEHAVAVTDENDAGKLVSHRFPQFSLSEELDPRFLKYIIVDEKFRHHLWLASPGGAGRNRVLNIPEMLQYEILIPSVPEQQKIANTLINLDNLITLHQDKYEKLKHIKQSLLEKMFA